MNSRPRSGPRRLLRPPVVLPLAGFLLAAAAVVLFLLLRRTGPARVSADALPIPHGAVRTATFVQCFPLTQVMYIANYPCDTDILIGVSAGLGEPDALEAEQRPLVRAGWKRVRAGWRSADYGICGHPPRDRLV